MEIIDNREESDKIIINTIKPESVFECSLPTDPNNKIICMKLNKSNNTSRMDYNAIILESAELVSIPGDTDLVLLKDTAFVID